MRLLFKAKCSSSEKNFEIYLVGELLSFIMIS